MKNLNSGTDQAGLNRRLEEAARYALLRRLTPALRHHLIGALQPIGMLAAMLERRAQAAAPDMPSIQKKSADMGVLSREATAACVDLIGWIAPKTIDAISVAQGVQECLSVLETDLALRGFVAVNETAGMELRLPRPVMRNVFAGALVALTDAAGKPAEVTLRAEDAGEHALLSISLRPREGDAMGIGGPSYRALDWQDVEALARAESIDLQHSADQVRLRCPVAAPVDDLLVK